MSLTRDEKALIDAQIAAYQGVIKQCKAAITRLRDQRKPRVKMTSLNMKISKKSPE